MKEKRRIEPFVLSSNILFLLSLGFTIAFMIMYLLIPGSNGVSIAFGLIASGVMVVFLVIYFIFGVKKPSWLLETEIVQYILNVVLLVLLSFIFSLGLIIAGIGSAMSSSETGSGSSGQTSSLNITSGFYIFFLFSMVAYILMHLLFLIITGVSLGETSHVILFRVFYILNSTTSIILVVSIFSLFAEANVTYNPLPYLYLAIACSDLGCSFRLEEVFKKKKALQINEEPNNKE